jgi:hypothetical protein
MADGKYARNILTGKKQNIKAAGAPVITVPFEGPEDWCGISPRIGWKFVYGPAVLADAPHAHPFEECLIFLGNKPGDPAHFGAEVEISLGEEGETYTITAGSVVCLPPGLVHGPVRVKSVTGNIVFGVIRLAPEYSRQVVPVRSFSPPAPGAGKYAKYILKEPKGASPLLPTEAWGVGVSEKVVGGAFELGCNFNVLAMLGAHMLVDPPHGHDCDEFLYLLPASAENWPDLGGEVNIGLGDGWEKQTITTAAIICLPKGTQHCPVFMKKVEKPFYWGHMLPVSSYASSEYKGEAL